MEEHSFLGEIGLRVLAALLPFLRPQSDFHWVFLAGFVATAFAVWLVRRGEAGGQGFLAFLFPREIWRQASPLVDLKLLLANGLFTLYFAQIDVAVRGVAVDGLTRWLGPSPALDAGGLALLAFGTLALGLAGDLGMYLGHRLMHRVPVLWEFHKVHHSAPVLVPFTALRQHPLDIMVNGFAIAVVVGLVGGVVHYLSPGFASFDVNRHNAVEFLFILTFLHFRHSHIWIDWGPLLGRVLISPAQHQIHHSADPAHYGRNFGVIFALWDWMFGTLYCPRGRELLTFGLGPETERQFRTLRHAYVMPFIAAGRLVAAAISRRAPPPPAGRSAPL